MRLANSILQLLAGCLILVQTSLPLAHSAFSDGDLSELICNPSGQSLSADARNATQALLEALGVDPEPDGPAPDCERCVTPSVALPAAVIGLTSALTFTRAGHDVIRSAQHTLNGPRGPPCGTRAPPKLI